VTQAICLELQERGCKASTAIMPYRIMKQLQRLPVIHCRGFYTRAVQTAIVLHHHATNLPLNIFLQVCLAACNLAQLLRSESRSLLQQLPCGTLQMILRHEAKSTIHGRGMQNVEVGSLDLLYSFHRHTEMLPPRIACVCAAQLDRSMRTGGVDLVDLHSW